MLTEPLSYREPLGIMVEDLGVVVERLPHVTLNAREVYHCQVINSCKRIVLLVGGVVAEICAMSRNSDTYSPSRAARMATTITAISCLMGYFSLFIPISSSQLSLSERIAIKGTANVVAVITSTVLVDLFTTEKSMESGISPYLGYRAS